MAYNQSFQQPGAVQITKRPITDEEQSNALVYYASLRKGSRGMATASMFMAFLNVAVISGTLPVADLAILFTVLALACGLAAMGFGGMTLKARKQIATAFKEGYVIEVRAPAYLNRAGGSKLPMWNVGPVSVMQTPETQALLAEGAPASVVCVPGVKAALSVNGTVLRRGASITMPPNLASMATAQVSPPAPQYQPVQGQAYHPQPQPQSFPPQPQYPEPQQQPFPQPQAYPQQQQQPYPQPQQQQQYQQPQAYPQQQQPFPQPQAYPQQQQPFPQPQAYPQQQQPYPQPQAYPQQQPQQYQQPQPQPQPQPYPEQQQPQQYPQQQAYPQQQPQQYQQPQAYPQQQQYPQPQAYPQQQPPGQK